MTLAAMIHARQSAIAFHERVIALARCPKDAWRGEPATASFFFAGRDRRSKAIKHHARMAEIERKALAALIGG